MQTTEKSSSQFDIAALLTKDISMMKLQKCASCRFSVIFYFLHGILQNAIFFKKNSVIIFFGVKIPQHDTGLVSS